MRQSVIIGGIRLEHGCGKVSRLSDLKGKAVIHRSVSAGIRACLVSTLVAIPALLVPGIKADTTQIVVLLSLLAGLLVFVEYSSASPSLVEFRSAPPFNRVRFTTLFVTVFAMTQIQAGTDNALTSLALSAAQALGNWLDFPFSPVRLALLALPAETPADFLAHVRAHAGLAYAMSLVTILIFASVVFILDWPLNSGSFNVLINLPLFDPTTGGDVLHRMKRDTVVNLVLGFLMPFLLPAIVKLAAPVLNSLVLVTPQTMIWTICIWAFIPASMFMRGIALWRISNLIEEKRRRTYAQHEEDGGFQAA